MEAFFYFCLFVFGTLFGSFWSVVIYRLKSWENGIMWWRSHCQSCNRLLKAVDLIPIVSWVLSKAKCINCKEKISSVYPLLELTTWLVFAFIWYFLIDFNALASFEMMEITKLFFWLSIWFITVLYSFYDILFLEIHEWILLTWIWLIILWLWAQTLFSDFNLISILPSWVESISIWISAIVTTLVILWLLYTIMLKELSEIIDIILLSLSIGALYLFNMFTWINLEDIAILNGLIWVLIIFIFFYLQIVISRWAWLWWGDLRIAIMIWLILWVSYSFPGLMLTYLSGSIIWISFIIYTKLQNSKEWLNSAVPFWPFLAIWFLATIFYSEAISNMISQYL